MKLISLNTWGGRGGLDELLAFFDKNKAVDIFCLQEMWQGGDHMEGKRAGGSPLEFVEYNLLNKICAVLKDHVSYFRPHYEYWYGLALLAKKSLHATNEGELFVYQYKGYLPEGDKGNHARNIQYITVETANGLRTIVHIHGIWNGQGKTDSPDRIKQSENVLAFLATLTNPYVLCGDFNLLPDTESLKMFERAGLRNLISENGITSTRSSFYTKPDKFADYIFVSDGVKVNEFKVLPDEVSDHMALYLDFE
jgi:endonuclease/exonuclease/phosphatase family metal-dependent hydrolase